MLAKQSEQLKVEPGMSPIHSRLQLGPLLCFALLTALVAVALVLVTLQLYGNAAPTVANASQIVARPCQGSPTAGFSTLYTSHADAAARLGCAAGPLTYSNGTEQRTPDGYLIWLRDGSQLYRLHNPSAQPHSYLATSQFDPPPANLYSFAGTQQIGLRESSYQMYAHGLMIWLKSDPAPDDMFVLYDNTTPGDGWQRFLSNSAGVDLAPQQ